MNIIFLIHAKSASDRLQYKQQFNLITGLSKRFGYITGYDWNFLQFKKFYAFFFMKQIQKTLQIYKCGLFLGDLQSYSLISHVLFHNNTDTLFLTNRIHKIQPDKHNFNHTDTPRTQPKAASKIGLSIPGSAQ